MARVCAVPGCPLLAVNRTHCEPHRLERERLKAVQRSEAGKWAQQQYRTKRWAAKRKAHLTAHPWCECPEHKGQRVKADTVDHERPHRGDPHLFWHGKLMSLTRRCHSSWKQRVERTTSPETTP